MRKSVPTSPGSALGFRTLGNTETVLTPRWRRRGEEAIGRLRGMYAFCFVDGHRRVALLARDPLGVKPLYCAEIGPSGAAEAEFVFASEVVALREHPLFTSAHDPVVIASYMSTTRTTLGERTLYRDARILEPGSVLRINFAADRISRTKRSCWDSARAEGDASETAGVVRESIRRHLRSDVPLCSLLSGGLDSSIVALVTNDILRSTQGAPTLRTYASGAKGASAPGADDFAFARMMAERLGTVHTEAPVTATMFERRWAEMVGRQGLPLSTPNEVAINEVARTLRADGCVVTLSGEGADELFGGYDFALLAALQFHRGSHPLVAARPDLHPGEFELLVNAWLSFDSYQRVFQPGFLDEVEGGAPVRRWYRDEFDRCGAMVPAALGGDVLATHLAFQRRTNLAQLLLRLDSATMLEGVEGRTPFADSTVARFAESLPVADRFIETEPRKAESTKISLRHAFASALPREILTREKASFPLPFASWIGSMRRVLLESDSLGEVFTPESIEAAAANPSQYWNVAWPMMNLALWMDAGRNIDAMDHSQAAGRAAG